MFKIVDFQSFPDGKSRITIETDDSSTRLMLRFFSQADKFAQVFQYRIQTESRLEASQKSKSVQMAQMRQNRARMLEKYREIAGTHNQRIKILQEMCIGEGVKITQDRISAQLQNAREEEKEVHIVRIKRLIRKGKSIGEVASSLGLPKSTVARYAKAKKTDKPSVWGLYPLPASEKAR